MGMIIKEPIKKTQVTIHMSKCYLSKIQCANAHNQDYSLLLKEDKKTKANRPNSASRKQAQQLIICSMSE